MTRMIFDSDDFGATHVISDMCQSHDCRDVLLQLKDANPAFKATLFTIPGEVTQELLDWSWTNNSWVELAVHGFYHTSNYECEKLVYEGFAGYMVKFADIIGDNFVKGFKAPGWQISDDVYQWLRDNGWWVADQPFNAHRRPEGLKAYEVGEDSYHTHTWNCVGNGVYELLPDMLEKVKQTDEFLFVSEVVA